MNNQKVLQQCAESFVFLIEDFQIPKTNQKVKAILKHRIAKAYRIPEIEQHISLQRIRQETRNLKKALNQNLPVPKIYHVDEKEKKIYMEYFENFLTLKEFFQKVEDQNFVKNVFYQLGVIVGKLHNNKIVHGDLTSSNVMIDNENNSNVKLIDFGLSQITDNIEEKAVDLYVLEKSLVCEKNGQKFQEMFDSSFIKGYQESCDKFQLVKERLEKVKLRGRKRVAFGQLFFL